MVNPLRGCYSVPGAQVWERHICGKKTPLQKKEKKAYVTDKYKKSVP